jgi:hypothetical protein
MLEYFKTLNDETIEIVTYFKLKINKIFNCTKTNKVSLSDLTNEFIYKDMIMEW